MVGKFVFYILFMGSLFSSDFPQSFDEDYPFYKHFFKSYFSEDPLISQQNYDQFFKLSYYVKNSSVKIQLEKKFRQVWKTENFSQTKTIITYDLLHALSLSFDPKDHSLDIKGWLPHVSVPFKRFGYSQPCFEEFTVRDLSSYLDAYLQEKENILCQDQDLIKMIDLRLNFLDTHQEMLNFLIERKHLSRIDPVTEIRADIRKELSANEIGELSLDDIRLLLLFPNVFRLLHNNIEVEGMPLPDVFQ